MKFYYENELNKLTNEELLSELKKINLLANAQRYRENKKFIEEYGETKKAASTWSDYKFIGNKTMRRGELLYRYVQARNYLELETATVKGFKSFVGRLSERTGLDAEKFFVGANQKIFWKVYRRIYDKWSSIFSSTNIMQTIDGTMSTEFYTKTYSVDELIEKIINSVEDTLTKRYEDDIEEEDEYDDRRFDFGGKDI